MTGDLAERVAAAERRAMGLALRVRNSEREAVGLTQATRMISARTMPVTVAPEYNFAATVYMPDGRVMRKSGTPGSWQAGVAVGIVSGSVTVYQERSDADGVAHFNIASGTYYIDIDAQEGFTVASTPFAFPATTSVTRTGNAWTADTNNLVEWYQGRYFITDSQTVKMSIGSGSEVTMTNTGAGTWSAFINSRVWYLSSSSFATGAKRAGILSWNVTPGPVTEAPANYWPDSVDYDNDTLSWSTYTPGAATVTVKAYP
jgi:hypothetical protein